MMSDWDYGMSYNASLHATNIQSDHWSHLSVPLQNGILVYLDRDFSASTGIVRRRSEAHIYVSRDQGHDTWMTQACLRDFHVRIQKRLRHGSHKNKYTMHFVCALCALHESLVVGWCATAREGGLGWPVCIAQAPVEPSREAP